MPAEGPTPAASPPAPATPQRWRMAEHWPELVTALTDQSIESVVLLLRGLELLVRKGRLTQAEYKVLALPAERLKHVGMSAQQIVRFQSGRVRQSHEKIDLAYLLECVLQERRDELALQGLAVWRKFEPADVLIDPALGFSLAQAMLDWSIRFGHRIDLRLDLTPATPARARLRLETYADPVPEQDSVFDDGIHWLLLRQIAATDGAVELERSLDANRVVLSATFGRTLAQAGAAPAARPEEVSSDPEAPFKSVSGAHVLLVSDDPATCEEAQAIVRKLGLTVEAAGTEQAREAMRRREPDLIVIDAASLPEHAALELRTALAREHAQLPVLEIVPTEGGASTHGLHSGIARDALAQSLGPAVMFTLSGLL
ncbi:MAG: hypothetical protein RJA36_1804 [Pseudomonadota bacterium]|jgi:hypothetical protein